MPFKDGGNVTGQKFITGPVHSHTRSRWEKEHETERGGAQATGNIETGGDMHKPGHFIFRFFRTD